MLENDIQVTTEDLQRLKNGRDEVVRLFERLGYNVSRRIKVDPSALDVIAATSKSIKHMEKVAGDDDLEVYLVEVSTITLAHRRAILQAFSNRGKQFLFILITPDPECERVDFVLSPMEAGIFTPAHLSFGKNQPRPAARPYAITIKPSKFGNKDRRLISRFTYTCSDGLAQADKLFSVFKYAEWGQENFNNVGLFSDHYLKERLPEEEPLWEDKAAAKAAFTKLRALGDKNKASTARTVAQVVHPVLKQFGHEWKEEKAPDGKPMLRLNATTVCLAYAWERPLDMKAEATAEHPDDVPATRVVPIFEQGLAEWVILTNGQHWRLYSARAHARHANYFEVFFREALAVKEDNGGEAFLYFWLFLRAEAFVAPDAQEDEQEGRAQQRCLLDRVLDGSRDYALKLGEDLKNRVFNEIFPYFAEGFVAHMRKAKDLLSEEDLDGVYHGTLTLLYRLIFLLYAESRNLLPIHQEDYREASLRKLCEDISDTSQQENASEAVERIGKQKVTSSKSDVNLYESHLLKLFAVVDQGDKSKGVPKYNGGLFQTLPKDDDQSPEAVAARFLSTQRIPNHYLALGLDKLFRLEDDRTHFLKPVDYKSLGVRQLGSIYEGLLEFKVRVANERMAIIKGTGKSKNNELVVPAKGIDPETDKVVTRSRLYGAVDGYLRKGSVYLENDKHERKASGSYYTPDYIVKYIVKETVGPALQEKFDKLKPEFRKAQDAFKQAKTNDDKLKAKGLSGDNPEKVFTDTYRHIWEEFFKLRVLDPAMGSGHFLVEAVDFITDKMLDFLNRFDHNPIQSGIARTRASILSAMKDAGIAIDVERLSDINLLKRHVLKRCIFGVDLNPMAVELAKVSLWLDCFTIGAPLSFLDHHLKCGNSLIGVGVDETQDAMTEKGDMFGNRMASVTLATKIMREVASMPDTTPEEAALSQKKYGEGENALWPYKRILDVHTSLWFSNPEAQKTRKKQAGDAEKQLTALDWLKSEAVDEFLNASIEGFLEAPKRPLNAKRQLSMLEGSEKGVLRQIVKRRPGEVDEKQLSALDKALHAVRERAEADHALHRFFHWELEFPEVFYEAVRPGSQEIRRIPDAGFDAVVGNPPYVRQEKIKPVKSFLRPRFQCDAGAADLFIYFYELSLRQLAKQGRTAFICSGTWTKTGSGRALREHLKAGSTIESFVDFGDLPVFADATTYPCIVVMRKAEAAAQHQVRSIVVPGLGDNGDPDLYAIFDTSALLVPQSELDGASWRFENRALAALREKIRQAGVPLKEYCGSPKRGVLTGLNEAFVIDRATRDRLIKEDPKSAEVLKPFLEGKDIKAWRAEPRDLWLIFTRRGVDIEKYPAILRHLAHFRERLEPCPSDWDEKKKGKWKGRKAGSYEWYEIQDNVAYYQDFEAPKIVYPDIASFPKFMLERSGSFATNTVYLIATGFADYFLLGVMQSAVIWCYLSSQSQPIRGGYHRMFSQYIENVGIAKGNQVTHREISRIACEVSDQESAAPRAELEARVAHAYGLNEAEFALVLAGAHYLSEEVKTKAQEIFRGLS